MNPAILFACLSLLFAGFNDVVFKNYSRKERSRGMNVLGIGVVWSLLQTVTFLARGTPVVWDGISIGYGLGAGLFLTLSNLLLLESLTHINVGLGATIYRLNTIVSVLFSFWLFDRQFSDAGPQLRSGQRGDPHSQHELYHLADHFGFVAVRTDDLSQRGGRGLGRALDYPFDPDMMLDKGAMLGIENNFINLSSWVFRPDG
jgi:multidrug transporter EmrE-like cation transporter